MRTLKLSLGVAFLFLLAGTSFAQFGTIQFTSSSIYAHESAGSVTVSVSGTGQSGSVSCSIYARSTNSSRGTSSTAVIYVDYTTNSTFVGSGGEGAGFITLSGIANNTVSFQIPLLNNTNQISERTIFLD